MTNDTLLKKLLLDKCEKAEAFKKRTNSTKPSTITFRIARKFKVASIVTLFENLQGKVTHLDKLGSILVVDVKAIRNVVGTYADLNISDLSEISNQEDGIEKVFDKKE